MEIYSDINTATAAEYELPEGVYQVRFYLEAPPTPEEIEAVIDELNASSIEVREIKQGVEDGVDYLSVTYNRSVPDGIAFLPVAIIPLIGLIVVGGLIGIGIFKWEEITTGIAKLILIGGGVLIVSLALVRKPAMQYIEKKGLR